MDDKKAEGSNQPVNPPKQNVKFYILLILGSFILITALVNIALHLDDATVLVSRPSIALGIALIIIAFFYKPKTQ